VGLQDWTDLLAALDQFGIEYLIVGGVAYGIHAEPRYTKDLDLLVHVSPGSAERLFEALRQFGAPLHIVNASDFLKHDFVFYFGSPPWQIYILTSIPGVDFVRAYEDRVIAFLGGYRASFISKEWLIRAKLESARPQDLVDVSVLRLPFDSSNED
jgi:hypothetical protein